MKKINDKKLEDRINLLLELGVEKNIINSFCFNSLNDLTYAKTEEKKAKEIRFMEKEHFLIIEEYKNLKDEVEKLRKLKTST